MSHVLMCIYIYSDLEIILMYNIYIERFILNNNKNKKDEE